MRKAYCLFVFSLLCGSLFAQSVAVINSKSINSKEFIWVYKKSHNGNIATDYNDLLAYLNLYIDFKLKVLDAREMGLDKNANYQAEVKSYNDALEARKKAVRSDKDRDYLMNEYKDGVLMFNVSELKIWNKAQDDEKGLADFYKKNKQNYNKPLNEVKGEVIADYQQELEGNWLNSLREKYPIKINENELRKLAKL